VSRRDVTSQVEFELYCGFGRVRIADSVRKPFQADRPAIAKARWPYAFSRWRGACSRFQLCLLEMSRKHAKNGRRCSRFPKLLSIYC